MQLSETQRGHPSNLDHTSLDMDLLCNPDESAGDSTAAVRPRTYVPPPEPTLSSADPTSPTGTSDHDVPTTPSYGASFITDEIKSTHSRGDSWASSSHELLYEFPISLGTAATMQEAHKELTTTTRARKSSLPLSRSGATLDMAFLFKSTGPTSPGEAASKDKVNLKRMGLGIFKKRRDDEGSNQKAVYNSPPHDRAEPKVTLQGTPYLQIVPHPSPFKIEGLNISKSPGLLGPASPHQLSVPLHEDNPDAYGTETIDNWISTFTTQHQDDGFDSPTSKGISIIYNTPASSSKHNSDLISVSTLADDSIFKLAVNNNHEHDDTCEGVSQLRYALSINPPSSPKEHKRLVSIHIPDFDNQEIASVENGSLERLIETASGSLKENSDRRAADVLAGRGLRRPVHDLDQSSTTSSQRLKESKALPRLPSEAVESADNNNNLTTSSTIQVWRQRDAATSSVKARYIPRSRSTTMIKSFDNSQHHDIDGTEDQTDDQKDPTPPSRARSSQVQISADSTPTTTRGSMALSQAMLVAEQMPIPRGRHVNKPAPLLLRGRPGSKTKAVAIHAGDLDSADEPAPDPSATPLAVYSPDTDISKKSTGETPILLRPVKFKDLQRPALREPSPAHGVPSPAPCTPFLQLSMLPAPSETPPGVPPRSLARLASPPQTVNPQQASAASISSASSQGSSINFPKRSSSLILTAKNGLAYAQLPSQAQAPTQSPPQQSMNGNTRHLQPRRNISSRASNQSTPSSSRKEKMAARLEALERENKLLEAALMAVLKTGGLLNKCPCGFFESRSSSTPPISRIPKPSSSSLLNPNHLANPEAKQSRSRQTKRVKEGGKGSLDLRRAEKVKNGEGEGSDKDDGYLSVIAMDGSRNSSIYHGHGDWRERRESVASFESGESGVSALEVYLGTRV